MDMGDPTEPARPSEALLADLGQRVKNIRLRRGMSRRALASVAAVSERHLASLESGQGNVSVLVLRQVAAALGCDLAELLDEERGPEWQRIRALLAGRGQAELLTAQRALEKLFAPSSAGPARRTDRIAFIGMRGAGKSTLGRRLAAHLGRPFIELGQVISRLAGCPPMEIMALYGLNTYRRYEREALEETLALYPVCVIATAGVLVSSAPALDLLLEHCLTLWLRAEPEDHLARVAAQGQSGMATDPQRAIEDLRLILEGRAAAHARADYRFNTSGQSVEAAFEGLKNLVDQALAQAA